ncbi:MAG: hypothetical protein OXC46_03385 [Thaumarchaeota archaeon]|nr:hypothetical protein [Nitrososphaerota archaeon]
MTHNPKVMAYIYNMQHMLDKIKDSDDFKSNITIMDDLMNEIPKLGVALEVEEYEE